MSQTKITELWERLYPGEADERDRLLASLLTLKSSMAVEIHRPFPTEGLVYCVYADAFGDGLDGVVRQLARLKKLGVTVLWLLPLLDSPGRDEGFDIRDYHHVDARLGGNEALARLLTSARAQGIAVIFDIAVNHTSEEHSWFVQARNPASEFRDYYLWSDTGTEYAGVPELFPGLVGGNWSWRPEANAWNFHRFYPFQPDLNYRNPRVTSEMACILAQWRAFGVDGFRMDAAALLWKEDGTDCDSRPEVHLILKLFQACLDELAPGSLLLAEANVPAQKLRVYFGDGDECKAAYHFELMPQFFQALLTKDPTPLTKVTFPKLPDGAAWFTFLRLHDEVTLDLVPPEKRSELVKAYAPQPETRFRNDQAFSGRLFDLLMGDANKVIAAWSLLLSLPGTPILYYGDEIAMRNSVDYFRTKAAQTGYPDTRFLHRGPWDEALDHESATNPNSAQGKVRRRLEAFLSMRHNHPDLVAQIPTLSVEGSTLISVRSLGSEVLVAKTNLSNYQSEWTLNGDSLT